MENKKKYKLGYTCGVFDLFHVGHLNLLENCKKQCETLIVGICTDEYVIKINKSTKTPMPWSNIISNGKFGSLQTASRRWIYLE